MRALHERTMRGLDCTLTGVGIIIAALAWEEVGMLFGARRDGTCAGSIRKEWRDGGSSPAGRNLRGITDPSGVKHPRHGGDPGRGRIFRPPGGR
jgi:hypothetical protein